MFVVPTHSEIAPSAIQFENLSNNADYYHWDFGDGNSTVDAKPLHRYLLSGQYDITLSAIKGKTKHTHTQRVYIAAPTECTVVVDTDLGQMEIVLSDDTPLHRDNFIKHVENGYYDGMLFHRVISGFMVQTGDPDSKEAPHGKKIGGGGPGYTIPAELIDTLVHIRGALAAARTGDDTNPAKASSGSQFYIVDGRVQTASQLDDYAYQKGITYSPYAISKYTTIGGSPQLDKEYTVFGRVVRGMEVIDAITSQKTDEADRPLTDIRILVARVVR